MALWIPPLCIILSASPTHPLASLPGQSLSRCPRPRRYLSLIRRYYYIHTRMRGHTGTLSLSVWLRLGSRPTSKPSWASSNSLPKFTRTTYIYITGGWLVDWLVGWTGARDGTDGRLDFQGWLGTVSQSLTPFPFFPFSLRICLSRLSLLLSSFGFVCVCVQMGGENKQELQMRHFLIAEPFWAIGCFPFPNSPPPSSPLPLFTLLTFIIHLVIFCRPPHPHSPPPPYQSNHFLFPSFFTFFFFTFSSSFSRFCLITITTMLSPPFFFSLSLS